MIPALAPARFRTVRPYLEPPGHVAVHRFPVPATGEPVRRRTGYCHEHGGELGSHGCRARSDEVPAGDCLGRIVVTMTLEVDDCVGIVATGPALTTWIGTEVDGRSAGRTSIETHRLVVPIGGWLVYRVRSVGIAAAIEARPEMPDAIRA